jgi:hypothetical protein
MTEELSSLADETRGHLARLEALPCFQALSARTLPPESQGVLHQALFFLYQALEESLAASSHPALVAVRAEEAPPLPPFLEPGLVHEAPQGGLRSPVLVGALAQGERIRSAARREPLSLLGHHYALRLSLFSQPGASPWVGLARQLEGLRLEDSQAEGLVRAARESFSGVRSLLDALHPPRALPPSHWLNRDAGGHPITLDVDELRAALRAAEASWEEFPYYAWRFGERGRQFCWSDSAWLVTMGGQAEEQVWKHVSWQGRLLAPRGMPRLLLERHLLCLYRELVRAKPSLQDSHSVLRRVAERLAGERRRFIDDPVLRTLGADFEARVGPEWSQRMRGSGELLAAAVADECAGIPEAVDSLALWMCESSRFPSAWCLAVEQTLARARQLVADR